MRGKLIIALGFVAAGAAVFMNWREGQATAERLRDERDAFRRQKSELAWVHAEHGRLRAELAVAIRRSSPRSVEPPRVASPELPPEPIISPTSLAAGEWARSTAWTNRGRSTPAAAVETVLWAAAGGDVPTLISLLDLSGDARVKAADLLNRLSAESRQAFGSPEALIASATLNRIPVTEAQVTWFNEIDADNAVVALMTTNHGAPPAIDAEKRGTAGAANAPPSLTDEHATKLTYLTLRRGASGWQIVVPPAAVDRIAREWAPGGG